MLSLYQRYNLIDTGGWYSDFCRYLNNLKRIFQSSFPQYYNQILLDILKELLQQKNISLVNLIFKSYLSKQLLNNSELLIPYQKLTACFKKKLVVLDLDETLFSYHKEFQYLLFSGERFIFRNQSYYLINNLAYQYVFEHLLLSAHKVIILTSACYERTEVLDVLNRYFLPLHSKASFSQIDYYNAYNYGTSDTNKGDKLSSILQFMNARLAKGKEWHGRDILLLDDNVKHLDSVRRLDGRGVMAGQVGYLQEFVKRLRLGIEGNLPAYESYEDIFESIERNDQIKKLVKKTHSHLGAKITVPSHAMTMQMQPQLNTELLNV